MYFTIYKITNKLNNKFYIGKHQTKDLNDEYLGSGVLIRRAIKKYGKENFEKEILFVFDNEAEMNAKEKELVTINSLNMNESYNIAPGGIGGNIIFHEKYPFLKEVKEKMSRSQRQNANSLSERAKQNHQTQRIGMYGKKQTPKQKEIAKIIGSLKPSSESIAKQKISLQKTLKAENYKHPNKGKKRSDECRKNMSLIMIARLKNNKNPMSGKNHTTVSKQLQSEMAKKRKRVICEHCNNEYDVSNYTRWHGINCRKIQHEISA